MFDSATNSQPTNLERQLNAVVVRHPHLYQRKLSFRTDQGHVTLHGRVRSFFEKQMAQEALRSLDGITSIDNQLEVNWVD